MNNFLGHKVVPWPQRPCFHRGLEALVRLQTRERPYSRSIAFKPKPGHELLLLFTFLDLYII